MKKTSSQVNDQHREGHGLADKSALYRVVQSIFASSREVDKKRREVLNRLQHSPVDVLEIVCDYNNCQNPALCELFDLLFEGNKSLRDLVHRKLQQLQGLADTYWMFEDMGISYPNLPEAKMLSTKMAVEFLRELFEKSNNAFSAFQLLAPISRGVYEPGQFLFQKVSGNACISFYDSNSSCSSTIAALEDDLKENPPTTGIYEVLHCDDKVGRFKECFIIKFFPFGSKEIINVPRDAIDNDELKATPWYSLEPEELKNLQAAKDYQPVK